MLLLLLRTSLEVTKPVVKSKEVKSLLHLFLPLESSLIKEPSLV
jgi:hypothetical protein